MGQVSRKTKSLTVFRHIFSRRSNLDLHSPPISDHRQNGGRRDGGDDKMDKSKSHQRRKGGTKGEERENRGAHQGKTSECL